MLSAVLWKRLVVCVLLVMPFFTALSFPAQLSQTDPKQSASAEAKGIAFEQSGQFDSAAVYFRIALNTCSEDNLTRKGQLLVLVGKSRLQAGHYSAAVDSLIQAEQFFSQLGKERHRASALNLLGTAHSYQGDHYKAIITSSEFIGKSRIAQHQMVYAALNGQMGGVLHALALETKAPAP